MSAAIACGSCSAAAAGAALRSTGAKRRRDGGAALSAPARPSRRAPAVAVRAAWRQSAAAAGRGLALSLFHRFRGGLPPDGELLPPDEQMCDPFLDTCKTPLHVHECPCPSCGGSGWARAPPRARCGRGGHRGGPHRHAFRGSLHQCLACHGLGYARVATVEPPLEESYLTLARPAEADPRAVSAARLRQALRGTGRETAPGATGPTVAGAVAAAAGGAPPPTAAAAEAAEKAAAALAQQQQSKKTLQQQQQQQREREREAALGSLDRAAFWRGVRERWQQGGGEGGGGGVGAGAGGDGAAGKKTSPSRAASPAPAK